MKRDDLRRRLQSCKDCMVQDEKRYEAKARNGDCVELEPDHVVREAITVEEMVSVYNGRLARKGTNAREVYDHIRGLATRGICPLCGHRTASTLDHYLPKTQYPELAITPINLIPACMDCNKKKGDGLAASKDQQTWNPYFDVLNQSDWLWARIIEVKPAGVTYMVVPPESWDSTTTARVKRHFDTFELAPLYSAQAANEIAGIRHMLAELHDKGGADAVEQHCRRQMRSMFHDEFNRWRGALYRAMAESDWFVNGGFCK